MAEALWRVQVGLRGREPGGDAAADRCLQLARAADAATVQRIERALAEAGPRAGASAASPGVGPATGSVAGAGGPLTLADLTDAGHGAARRAELERWLASAVGPVTPSPMPDTWDFFFTRVDEKYEAAAKDKPVLMRLMASDVGLAQHLLKAEDADLRGKGLLLARRIARHAGTQRREHELAVLIVTGVVLPHLDTASPDAASSNSRAGAVASCVEVFTAAGRHAEAVAALRWLVDTATHDNTRDAHRCTLAEALAATGRHAEAVEELKEIGERSGVRGTRDYLLAKFDPLVGGNLEAAHDGREK